MKVLVTGGIGFIGKHVVNELIENKYDVAIIDEQSTNEQFEHHRNIRCYSVDINSDLDGIFETEKPDCLIHLAAQVDVGQSIINPKLDATTNILGTIHVLEKCNKHDVKKVIFSSTAAVYGDPIYLPVDEKHPQLPLSFYGISKLTAEHYIKTYCGIHGLNFTILRYSNVYGPGSANSKGEGNVISIFLNKMLEDSNPIIFGDGNQTRDFIYVKDIATANVAAIEQGNNQILNVSTNTKTSLNNLVRMINNLLVKDIEPIYSEGRNGDILHSYLNNKKALNTLNWKAKYSLEQGLNMTLLELK
ncbi:NAD-dependent epimerase/dehydratase family protein [Aquibacillus halophilus]|uniref:NAD-dependent epimerase/dehydratase family protein n=1 Tax=Aquibacillus halophilus TaxID=930132 RepID=A0A6A8D7P5_9BACI|nr:NAD-dependent epimerase/dehydratase family protein [Aquibacillus halophilus]MRH41775.1 NAD-dependent epimerase/dehydratase family protein [Aquibacillus halophilus]